MTPAKTGAELAAEKAIDDLRDMSPDQHSYVSNLRALFAIIELELQSAKELLR